VDGPTFAVINPDGIFASVGKRGIFGGGVQFSTIDFNRCRGFGATEYTDDRGFGKFAIDFAGAGNLLLGRLFWTWRGKRFRDNRNEIMAVAGERDRILETVGSFLGS
jgi:hypothetical protein